MADAGPRAAAQTAQHREEISTLVELLPSNMALEDHAQLAVPALPSGPSNAAERGVTSETPLLLSAPDSDDDEETESEIELEMDLEEEELEYASPPQANVRDVVSPLRPDSEVNVPVDDSEDDEAFPLGVHATDDCPESTEANGSTDRTDAAAAAPSASISERAPPPSSDDGVLTSEPPPSTDKTQESSSDALLMRVVLDQPYNGTTARARTAFWDSIVTAFKAAGGGDMASRADVTKRIAVLTLTLLETPHLLPASLRAMVLEFNEQNCAAGFAARFTDPFLTTLRRHTNEGEVAAPCLSPAADLLAANEVLRRRAAEDEQLLQLVFQHKPFEVCKVNRSATWEQIYSDYTATHIAAESSVRGQLSSPVGCERRVAGTAPALLDRKHPYHVFLSQTLRTMLVEYHLLTIPASAETVAPGSDELFMRIVLEKRPFDAVIGARAKVWEVIVQAFVAAGGELIQTSTSATRRVVNLTKMHLERPDASSQDLRGMLLKYHELRYASSAGGTTDKVMLERLRKTVREIPTADGETCRPAGVAVIECTDSHQAIESPTNNAVDEPANETHECAVDEDTAAEGNEESMEIDLLDGESGLMSARPGASSSDDQEIHASNDELLMQIALAHRPVETTVLARTSGWDAVVNAFVAAGGVGVASRVAVTQRIGFLTLTLLESPHLLTPHLRELILDFNTRNYEAGFAQRLGEAFIATLRRNATKGKVTNPLVVDAANHADIDNHQALREKALEDEKFMRLVMKYRPFEAGREGKTPYWKKIMDAYNATLDDAKSSVRGRIGSTNTAHQRVRFASTAFLDCTTRYHPFLTPALRAMVVEFGILNVDIAKEMVERDNGGAQPTVQTPAKSNVRRAVQAEIRFETLPQELPSKKRSARTALTQPPAITESAARLGQPQAEASESSTKNQSTDELFMRIVLEKRPFDVKRGEKRSVWHSIADAFIAAGGTHMRDGRAAAYRVGALTKTMLEAPQLLAPKLREKILEYHEHYRESDGRYKVEAATLETLRVHASLTDEKNDDEDEGDEASMRAKAIEDERLVRLVMKIRPFDVQLSQKKERLKAVVAAYNASLADSESAKIGGKLTGPKSVSRRLRCMTNAWQDSNNPYHAYLSPTVRAMLVELTAHKDNDDEPEQSSLSQSVQDVGESTAPPGSTVLTTPPDARLVRVDEELMRLVLDTRPYFVRQSRTAMWKAVADKLQKITKTLADGHTTIDAGAVRARAERLVGLVRDRDHEEYDKLSPAVRAMVVEYTKVNNIKLHQLVASLYRPTPTASEEAENTPVVQESLDDVLLREVLGIRFKSGQSKAAWDRVAKAVNTIVGATVFTRGKTCKQRVQTLRGLYRDPLQAETLGANEREKLMQLDSMLQRKQTEQPRGENATTATEPTHFETTSGFKPASSETAGDPSQGGESQEASSSSSGGYMTLLPALDVRFMRLVLDALPTCKPTGEKTAAWDTLAAAWTAMASEDTTVKLPTGKQAIRRVQSLVAVYRDPAHREHPKLTKPLKELLREYNSIKAKYDAKRLHQKKDFRDQLEAKRSRSTLTPDAESSPCQPPKKSKPASMNVSSILRASPMVSGGTGILRENVSHRVAKQSQSAATAVLQRHDGVRAEAPTLSKNPPPTSTPTGSFGGRRWQYTTVLPSLDESLMRLVLDKRPFCQPIGQKKAAWDKVAQIWLETAGSEAAARIPSGNALARVQFLVMIYRDQSHREYGRLTESLKDFLREYVVAKDDFEALGLHRKQDRDKRQGKRTRPEPTPEPTSPPLQQAKKARDTSTSTDVSFNPQPASHSPERDSTAGSTVGGIVESSATRSKRRSVQENDTVPSKRQRMTVDEDNGERGSDGASNREDDSIAVDTIAFRLALEVQPFRVGYGLRRDAWDKVAWTVNREIGRYVFSQGSYVHAHIKRVLARLETDPESIPMKIRELAAQYNALLPSPTTSRPPQLAITVESETPATPICPVTPRSPTREPQAHLPNVQLARDVQSEVVMLRESVARLSDQVTVLTKEAAETASKKDREVAAARAETAELVAEFKVERREFRLQQAALVELLKSEREAQRRETQTMLAAFDRERKDRRDEFAAMANLMATDARPAATAAQSGQQLHEIDADLDSSE